MAPYLLPFFEVGDIRYSGGEMEEPGFLYKNGAKR